MRKPPYWVGFSLVVSDYMAFMVVYLLPQPTTLMPLSTSFGVHDTDDCRDLPQKMDLLLIETFIPFRRPIDEGSDEERQSFVERFHATKILLDVHSIRQYALLDMIYIPDRHIIQHGRNAQQPCPENRKNREDGQNLRCVGTAAGGGKRKCHYSYLERRDAVGCRRVYVSPFQLTLQFSEGPSVLKSRVSADAKHPSRHSTHVGGSRHLPLWSKSAVF